MVSSKKPVFYGFLSWKNCLMAHLHVKYAPHCGNWNFLKKVRIIFKHLWYSNFIICDLWWTTKKNKKINICESIQTKFLLFLLILLNPLNVPLLKLLLSVSGTEFRMSLKWFSDCKSWNYCTGSGYNWIIRIIKSMFSIYLSLIAVK